MFWVAPKEVQETTEVFAGWHRYLIPPYPTSKAMHYLTGFRFSKVFSSRFKNSSYHSYWVNNIPGTTSYILIASLADNSEGACQVDALFSAVLSQRHVQRGKPWQNNLMSAEACHCPSSRWLTLQVPIPFFSFSQTVHPSFLSWFQIYDAYSLRIITEPSISLVASYSIAFRVVRRE